MWLRHCLISITLVKNFWSPFVQLSTKFANQKVGFCIYFWEPNLNTTQMSSRGCWKRKIRYSIVLFIRLRPDPLPSPLSNKICFFYIWCFDIWMHLTNYSILFYCQLIIHTSIATITPTLVSFLPFPVSTYPTTCKHHGFHEFMFMLLTSLYECSNSRYQILVCSLLAACPILFSLSGTHCTCHSRKPQLN